ncbi:MAG TPA: DUF1289 domain-containing protein [Steroidobacteraceae bacterium]|nr:DUF1289 domain-containing protein [Steroidobacteraceae bacterium]
MTQPAPASPCMNVCVLDAGRTCVGCGRTIDEIARWGRMSAAEQWQVIARLGRAREPDRQQTMEFQQATRVAEG